MDRDTFLIYLKDPKQLKTESIQDLTEMISDFPYFQSARVLLLLNLYKEKHFRFDDELKTTAIVANNRSILKQHIDNMDKQAKAVLLPDEDVEVIKDDKSEQVSKAETEKKIDKSSRPIDDLIDEFIKNEPSISRSQARFFNPAEAAKSSVVDDENIVSETLAKIFFDQGKFEKAISIYRKLSLKFPEKSSYFAAQIEKIKKIIKTL